MTEGQGGSTPAGWYPDPEGNGERWWNGMSWGQLRQPPEAVSQQPHPPQAYGSQQLHDHQAQPGQQGQHGYPEQPQGGQPWAQQPQSTPAGQAAAGPGLRCVNCQFTDFAASEFALTPAGQFFDRGIGMVTAQCLICRRCGFIHWFATR
ncbi:MAG: DUF2510 domain-containing protein [Actinomycetota bacterium]|nr:DUF2510 domain-containing protein [Actinomycetota bacterium]